MRRLAALIGLLIIVGTTALACGPKKDAAPAGGDAAPKTDEGDATTE
ncbi:MAG: hypothetical protein ABI743_14735 [bacterium]